MSDLQERVAAEIEAAADYIEANGWVQRQATRHQPDGRVSACIVGALTRTHGSNLAFDALEVHLEVHAGRRIGLGRWNDASGRDVMEVLEEMRMAAKRVRAGDLELTP